MRPRVPPWTLSDAPPPKPPVRRPLPEPRRASWHPLAKAASATRVPHTAQALAPSPRRSLFTRAYRKYFEEGCNRRAQGGDGSRCKAHHAQYLNGLTGMGVARYSLELHRDEAVAKHFLNNATAARFADLTVARASPPHTCPQARFQAACPHPTCHAQFFLRKHPRSLVVNLFLHSVV